MTRLIFVRHAQPNMSWEDDRTRPLTGLGYDDSKEVTLLLSMFHVDSIYSSPYKRNIDMIANFAHKLNKEIRICEKLKERKIGEKSSEFLQMRWDDFNFCEEGGETLGNIQQRNIQELFEIVNRHPNECIVIGTHGTALTTILNYYDSSFNINYFKQIWHSMPYVIQVDFKGKSMVRTKELLRIDRGY